MTDYLSWQSELTLEKIFSEDKGFTYPSPVFTGWAYLTNIKEEGNRTVLIYNDGVNTQCITPSEFSLQTKINEYGGKPYWFIDNKIYFVNKADQRIYIQTVNIKEGTLRFNYPTAISPISENESRMYADIQVLAKKWVLSVVETEQKNNLERENSPVQENKHSIQAFFISENEENRTANNSQLLASGADFYSNLVINPAQNKVAWVQWNHPAMPWDETELWLADIDLSTGLPQFINAQRIPLEEGACVCQLLFSQNGQLFFSVDYSAPSIDSKNLSLPASIEETHKNFWNVVCLDVNDLVLQKVTSSFSEFGYPHWVYGDSRIVQFDPTTLLCFSSTSKGDELYFIDQTTLKVSNALSSPLNNQYFGNLSSDKCGRAIALMFSADDTPAVIEFSVDEKLVKYCDPIVLQRTVQVMPKTDISVAEHFSFPTRDGAESNGYYYSPCNSRYDHSGVPPLIVMVHGGPTARAYGYFDLQKQYWTSRGFAVFDVNHRGSNGYGRKYRDALKGQWGVLDTSDIVDGIDYLVSRDKADASKVCIRGKSAGGYAVLRALTEYPERFHAGACYYGIGNLATLAQITHKFEKFYTDHLIGEAYDPVFAREPKSLFYQRSPIYKLNQLQTPMIIFQGLEDKVVPPALAQEVIAALQAQSLSYSYVEYPNEGHGFRHAETNIDAWTKELAFYKSTLLTNN